MELSPRLYHRFVRPKFFTKLYINNLLQDTFDFKSRNVLDFGCGIGSSSSIFDPTHYLGIDLDSKRVAYAKCLYPTYRFDVFDGKKLPRNAHALDYIIMVAVLHHISSESIVNYLQQFREALKPAGRILVIEPCLLKGPHLNNSLMKFFDKGSYIRDQDEYMDLFERSNFSPIIIKKFRRFFYNELFLSAQLN